MKNMIPLAGEWVTVATALTAGNFPLAMGSLRLVVPRDRNGDFHQQTVPVRRRSNDALETTVIQLYQKGITTREISDLIEKMYGHYYSPQTVSNTAKAADEQVEAFHSRKLADKYAVIYCDATYLNLRHDSVAKEALHVILSRLMDISKFSTMPIS